MFEIYDVQYRGILSIPRLSIETGRITSIVGPSGSGKTTFLRMLNKMLSPDRGKIYWQGHDLAGVEAVKLRRQAVMLEQTPVIFTGSIGDNLQQGRLFAELPPVDDEALRQALAQVALDKSPADRPDDLSGGERQRLALARVMLMQPEVYLLDEPSAALDRDTADEVIGRVVAHIRDQGKTLVMVTHAQSLAERYSDAMIEIERGRVAACRVVQHG